jgi:hypothetical protein
LRHEKRERKEEWVVGAISNFILPHMSPYRKKDASKIPTTSKNT